MPLKDAPHIEAYGMLAELPGSVCAVIDALEAQGFEAWLVGGFVRDALRGVAPHDADIATNARWEQTRKACLACGMAVHETGTQHGTVTVVCQGEPIEVTTFRTEGAYTDHRHPDSVLFVNTIEEDLARRDFTINAMAFHPVRGLVDPFDGQNDLANKVIRCVNDPDTRLQEDALRMLRAMRFSSQLGFWIAPDTEAAIRKHAPALSEVAGERLRQELKKLLCGKAVRQSLLRFTDELSYIVPCIKRMKGFDQHNPWHVFDVWEHTAAVVEATPAYPLVRWAALFHDSGKPDTFFIGADNLGHMPNHPVASVRHVREAAKILRFSRKMQHDLELLVRYHGNRPEPTPRSVRKLYALVEHDEQLFHALCDLMRGDAQGKAKRATKWIQKIDDAENLFNKMVDEGQALSLADLPVNGSDLVSLGIPQGPQVGLVLKELFNAVANEKVEPEREALLALAKKLGRL